MVYEDIDDLNSALAEVSIKSPTNTERLREQSRLNRSTVTGHGGITPLLDREFDRSWYGGPLCEGPAVTRYELDCNDHCEVCSAEVIQEIVDRKQLRADFRASVL